MNICHIISSLDQIHGGPSIYLQLIVNNISNRINVSLLTIKSKNTLALDEKVNTIHISSSFPYFQGYSRELNKILDNSKFDLFHGNGLWQYPVHKMALITRSKNKPYIISPHGMLRPWALNQHKLKKQIALKLYQYKDLVNASCLHATSEAEAYEMKELGFINPIAVIPNGINLSEYSVRSKRFQSSQNTVLYLSRIFPKKGLEELITAWSIIENSKRKDWKIKIAGNGDEKYIDKLKGLITDKKLENEIELIGPKFGKEKAEVFNNADLFILPTHGENFGMAIAEALACSIPVITTKGAPWQELETHNAGWWIDIGAKPLAKTLIEAMQLNDDERMQMGLNGRKLVEEKYSIEIVAKKMIKLYEWILYKTEKPEFVI